MAQNVLSNVPYTTEWAKIDSLIGEGLPQSAREQLNELSGQIEKEEQAATSLYPHLVKKVLYEMVINAQLEEQGDWNAIWLLEEAAGLAESPVRAIYDSYLAEKYQTYYQQNRWKIGQRTSLEDSTPTQDETTWTQEAFLQRIAELYLSSLKDHSLRNLTLDKISPLVLPGENANELRPTIYDLLLHRALDYFNYNDAFVGQPAYDSDLDKLAFLATDASFNDLDLSLSDRTTSTQYVLQILQDALRWSMATRPGSPAHIDLDLRRLQFVYDYLQQPERHEAYEKALQDAAKKYQGQIGEAMVLVKLMLFHRQRGYAYNPADRTTANLQWSYKKAYEIAQDIKKRFPDTYPAQQASGMIADLESPSLSLQIEEVQLPLTDGLIAINYEQVEDLYLKLIPIKVEEYQERNKDNSFLAGILKRKAVQSWQERLPQVGDFRSHSTESAYRGLAKGVYCLAVSSRKDFSLESGATAYFFFWVSDLAILDKRDYQNGGNQHLIVSRSSGRPLAGVTVNIWTEEREGRKVVSKLQESLVSDENGLVRPQNRDRGNIKIELKTADDHLFRSNSYYLPERYGSVDIESKPIVYFFLDRGLYRPGQEVYFKALVVQYVDKVPSIVPNTKFSVGLYDVNGQEVESIDLTTNRFGSASESFTLPSGGLLGTMTLRTDLGRGSAQSFKVEEYKRPRFEASFEPLTEAVQLGDEVSIKGSAMAYAGPAVADAEVVYTIKRGIFFPWAYRGFGRYFPPGLDNLITIQSGKVRTDENGNFTLSFRAMPDGALNADQLPQYQFTIKADVIDGTGETRSANKTINLAKNPIKLDFNVDEDISKRTGLSVSISCTNLDGQKVDKSLQLVVEQLAAPEQTFVERYWELPEIPFLEEKEFRKRFPLFRYDQQDEPDQWPLKQQVWQQSIQSGETTEIKIAVNDWPVGHYRLRLFFLTEDGDTLSKVQHLRLHDWQKGQFASGQWLYVQQALQEAQPSDKFELRYGAQGRPLHLFTERSNIKEEDAGKWLLADKRTTFQTELTEADRGGVNLQTTYVLHNRVYSTYHNCSVPWNNKKLAFTYESFRSKLYPDAEEEWIIRIDGPDKDRVAAELLGSMYDQSLDQILPFQWSFSPYQNASRYITWSGNGFQQINTWAQFQGRQGGTSNIIQVYPSLLSLNPYQFGNIMFRSRSMERGQFATSAMGMSESDVPVTYAAKTSPAMDSAMVVDPAMAGNAAVVVTSYDNGTSSGGNDVPPPLKVRTNLSETAFFFPQLMTDKAGRVVLKFRAPESLTRWKVQLLAHTEDLAFALEEKEVVTQKELMILPNAPRFLREGDAITFTAKVSNLSEKELSGEAVLELFDLETEASLGSTYQLSEQPATFQLAPRASQTVSWKIEVPVDAAGVLAYRVIARSGNYADGEEAAIPVLTNRILLTEAQPLFVRAGTTKEITLSELVKAAPNTMHKAFRLDITSNPAWEAVKALPYLQEYPYDCTEQLVNRYFANALAHTLVKRYPAIREVFDSWKEDDTALQSPLLTNQELKTAVLEETPWVMDAKDESLQREQIAILFEEERIQNELASIERKILERQSQSGGFSWFPGGYENWYITQYIAEQFSHLEELQGEPLSADLNQLRERAIRYCDAEAKENYDKLKKLNNELGDYPPSSLLIHYLYMRSLNTDVALGAEYTEMYNYWWSQADKHWLKASLFNQALLALAAKKTNRIALAERIYRSIRERSLQSEEQGRYWKYNSGYYWYELPIETHVKLLELYQAMDASEEELADLKIWLLRNKETNRWETTKATAAAVNGLMNSGEDWLGETTPLAVSFPDLPAQEYTVRLTEAQANAEAGTGSYQVRWEGNEVQPALGTVRLENKSKVPGWGAMYWQRFATIDQVERTENNPLKIERELYRKTNEGQGDVLQALTTAPQQGDLITVRLVVRADRDMEFVHLKDLRASGLEPIDQLSGYRYQSALGYYQQTTDLGTHFFFDYLPKGEYVLEYELRVFHQGDFSGGLATLQCMYAPKFVSHSEGRRLNTVKRE
jgi:uncharacterized protein YfaS (alpha-2-macroglobulin family)